jgi:hypothetical protein
LKGFTEENLRKLGFNERQVKAVLYVKEKGKITNKEYREVTGLSDEGARTDLNELVEKRILLAKVVEGMFIMFLDRLAISWRLLGDSGDYLANRRNTKLK